MWIRKEVAASSTWNDSAVQTRTIQRRNGSGQMRPMCTYCTGANPQPAATERSVPSLLHCHLPALEDQPWQRAYPSEVCSPSAASISHLWTPAAGSQGLMEQISSFRKAHAGLSLVSTWIGEKDTLGVSVRGPSSETILVTPTYVTQIKDTIGSLYLYSESSQLLLPMSILVSYGNIKCLVSLLVICANQ